MTAKQYLRQLSKLQHRINILKEEIDERRTRLESSAAPELGDRVQSTPNSDRFAEAIAILADKDLQRQEFIYIYEQMRDTIVDQILELENDLQARVLYERYVRCQYWDAIAEELHYSRQHICRVHGSALIEFARKHPEL